jgi:hypothetical protein
MPQASDAVEAEGNLRRTILWGTQWGQLDGPAGSSLSPRTGWAQRAGRFDAPTYQLLRPPGPSRDLCGLTALGFTRPSR